MSCVVKARSDERRNHRSNTRNHGSRSNGNISNDCWKKFAGVKINSGEGDAPK